MQSLAPLLPLTNTSSTTPEVTYKLCSLAKPNQMPAPIKEAVDKGPVKESPTDAPLTPVGKSSSSLTSAFASYLTPPATVNHHPLLSNELQSAQSP